MGLAFLVLVCWSQKLLAERKHMKADTLNAAQVGKMFVTSVNFTYHPAGQNYNSDTGKYDKYNAHWNITARLSDKPSQYGDSQTMTLKVEEEVGQKLAEVLLPVIVADASRKAQQLADDSKAMLEALGDRALKCLTHQAEVPAEQ